MIKDDIKEGSSHRKELITLKTPRSDCMKTLPIKRRISDPKRKLQFCERVKVRRLPEISNPDDVWYTREQFKAISSRNKVVLSVMAGRLLGIPSGLELEGESTRGLLGQLPLFRRRREASRRRIVSFVVQHQHDVIEGDVSASLAPLSSDCLFEGASSPSEERNMIARVYSLLSKPQVVNAIAQAHEDAVEALV